MNIWSCKRGVIEKVDDGGNILECEDATPCIDCPEEECTSRIMQVWTNEMLALPVNPVPEDLQDEYPCIWGLDDHPLEAMNFCLSRIECKKRVYCAYNSGIGCCVTCGYPDKHKCHEMCRRCKI